MFEPPPEPRPESPVEAKDPDRFTVGQLLNIGRQFEQIAPDGFVSQKEFSDSLQRIGILSQGMEILPENFSTESTSLMQLSQGMDPFDTGYLNWRRFLVVRTKI